jgi:hypothetical protein
MEILKTLIKGNTIIIITHGMIERKQKTIQIKDGEWCRYGLYRIT